MESLDGLLALCIVLSAWALMAWLFIGAGLLAARAMGVWRAGDWTWSRWFWLGTAAVIAWLQVWHLLLPADGFALAATAGFAGAGWLIAFRDWRGAAHAASRPALRPREPASRVPIMLAALIVLFLAHRATGPCEHWDTGLYHAPAIRWAHEHAIVPGLGNLHWRLVFNNASFLVGAMMEVGPWRHGSPHFLSGILIVALTIEAVLGCGRLVRGTGRPRAESLVWVMLLLAIACIVRSAPGLAAIASPSPDTFAACMAIAAGLMAFRFLASHTRAAAPRSDATARRVHDADADAIACIAVLMAGVCAKISLAAFALPLALAVALVTLRRARGTRPSSPRRFMLIAIAVSGLLIVPWMARNIVLSGYPLFPAEFGRVWLPWTVEMGESVGRTEVMAWARTPPFDRSPGVSDADVLRDFAWAPRWWERTIAQRELFTYPALLSLVGVAIVIAACVIRRHWPRPSIAALGVALACAIALVAWFFTAPDPRFVTGPLWVLAIVTLAGGLGSLPIARLGRSIRIMAMTAIVLAALPLPYRAILAYARAGANPIPFLHRHLVLTPGPDRGLYPPPDPPLQTVVTHSGLTIHTNPATGQCWYGLLPNAPFVDRRLRLRREDDLGSGFIVDRTAPPPITPATPAASPSPSSSKP